MSDDGSRPRTRDGAGFLSALPAVGPGQETIPEPSRPADFRSNAYDVSPQSASDTEPEGPGRCAASRRRGATRAVASDEVQEAAHAPPAVVSLGNGAGVAAVHRLASPGCSEDSGVQLAAVSSLVPPALRNRPSGHDS